MTTAPLQDLEQRRALYSRELAAYTLGQWDSARKTMETKNSRSSPTEKSSESSSRRSTPTISHKEKDSRTSTKGVKVVDYARNSRKHAGDISRHEGRTVQS